MLNHHEYCMKTSVNKETNKLDLNLVMCYSPDDLADGEDLNFSPDSSRFILPVCMYYVHFSAFFLGPSIFFS